MSELTPVKDLLRVVDNASAIVGSYGRTRQPPQRIDRIALAELVAEHANQEMEAFFRFLYIPSPAVGRYVNLTADGCLRYGVLTPWRGASQLTWPQKRILGRWALLKAQDRVPSPLYFAGRRWRVNLVRFPTVETALEWLSRHALTGNRWLVLSEKEAA
jgi:hypothetical protein